MVTFVDRTSVFRNFQSALMMSIFQSQLPKHWLGISTIPSALLRQCDQMTKLCFQYLAIYSNEICPKAYKLCQLELKTLPKPK